MNLHFTGEEATHAHSLIFLQNTKQSNKFKRVSVIKVLVVFKDRALSTFGGFWLFAGRLSHINLAMIQLVTEFPKAQW